MTLLMISLEAAAVARGEPIEVGWGDHCLLLGASQDSVVSQGLIQVPYAQGSLNPYDFYIKSEQFHIQYHFVLGPSK